MSTTKWEDFEEYVKRKMKEEKIPGVAVAVSKKGEVIYEMGFGDRDITNNYPVTPDTIFGIASISKSFTALGILLLEERGLLSVTDPVVNHLPDFKLSGVEDMETIRIIHLLTHTTGLAPMERKENLNRLCEHIDYFSSHDHELLGRPGEFFSYCNDTFILLGAIIERITGKLFPRYITEEILNPLEMYRSTYSLEEVAKYTNASTPYDLNREGRLEQKPWPKLGNYEVGGGIRSTAKDLLKYGHLYINGGKIPKTSSKLISTDSIKKMWSNPFTIIDNQGYGYAFKVTENYHGVTLVEHGGGQPGVSSNFGFIPEKGIVVSVLSNVSNISAQEIWQAAINTELNLPINEKRYYVMEVEKDMEAFCEFIGFYDCKEGAAVDLYIQNSSPVAEINGETFLIKQGGNDKLIIDKTGMPLFFYRKRGEIWAMLFGSRMLIKRS